MSSWTPEQWGIFIPLVVAAITGIAGAIVGVLGAIRGARAEENSELALKLTGASPDQVETARRTLKAGG
jgi:VIT1/CCC1 family predicted Fe2+/Mn2+ transporter